MLCVPVRAELSQRRAVQAPELGDEGGAHSRFAPASNVSGEPAVASTLPSGLSAKATDRVVQRR